jgi:acetyl esterase/lipase
VTRRGFSRLLAALALPALLAAFSRRAHALVSFTGLLARAKAAATKRFSWGKDPAQFGELWQPSGAGPHPVAVMIHGGCWQATLPGVELMAYIAEDLRKAGIAVWNLEYRRLGSEGGGYPGTFEDVARGFDYLAKVAKDNALDLSKVITLGHSAGGHLALWAAARGRIAKDSPLHGVATVSPRAVITLAGINDLAAYRDGGAEAAACGGPPTIDGLIGAGKRKAGENLYADTSPAALLPLGVRQTIISGAEDPIVPASFGRAYASKARAAGDSVEELTIEKAGHFELIDPDSAAWARIRTLVLASVGGSK